MGRQPAPITSPRVTPTVPDWCPSSSMTCAGDIDSIYPAYNAPEDSRQKQASIANAAVLARVRVLYTAEDGGSRKATERSLLIQFNLI